MNEEQDKLSLAEENVEKKSEEAQRSSTEKPAQGDAPKAQPQTGTLTTPKKSSDKKQQVDAALENFTQKKVAEPVKKKHGWIGTVILLFIIGLGIYFMLQLASTVGETELLSLGEIISNINVDFAVFSLVVLLAVMVLEAFKFFVITKATTGMLRPLTSIKVAFLGKYYDGITPFSTGGQPMQIYYLHKKGYSAGTSTAIVLIKYFINTICWVSICFGLMVFNKNALFTYVTDGTQQQLFLIAGWVGWTMNALLPVSIVFFAIFPKITNRILVFFIGIATKISLSMVTRKEVKTGKTYLRRKVKILRRQQKWINSAHTAVSDFRSSFIVISHKPVPFILLVLSCIAEQFLTWAFPYFILIAFSNGQPSAEVMFAIMTLNVYAAMSASIIPTPGNSGVLENAVLLIFKTLATSVVFWVVFSWRFFTYYVYILIGLGLTIFEVIRGVVRNKRQNKAK